LSPAQTERQHAVLLAISSLPSQIVFVFSSPIVIVLELDFFDPAGCWIRK
jgi:hypothetical protein